MNPAPPPEKVLPPPAPLPPPPVVPHPAPVAALAEAPQRAAAPTVAWWLAGGGLAAGVVGTVLDLTAVSARAADRSYAVQGGTGHSLSAGAYQGQATQASVGVILWAVGGALLAGAALVGLSGGSR